MQINQGVGLGQRLLAGTLSLLAVISLNPAGAIAADLGSTVHTTPAATGGIIKVGGTVMTVRPGDMLTDAQQAALAQVLGAGKQTLLLNNLGAAVGGRFNAAGMTGNLVIPQGVMGLQNVNAASALNLGAGSLSNAGSLFFYSSNPSSTLASLQASSILNQSGARLGTLLPSALLASLGGISRVDLNLISPKIENHGLIASSGDLNISAPGTSSISINNVGGTLQALGNINVRDAGFTAKSNFSLFGGDVLSNALNINSGDGAVSVNVGALTGVVNINGGTAHVAAATENLRLGAMNLTGDPTFYNSAGNIDLLNLIPGTNGQPLAIVAKGNITSGIAGLALDTSSTTGDGGQLTLIAGANMKVEFAPANDEYPNPADPGTKLTILGGSSTGGKIDLAVATKVATSITTASTLASGHGGELTMVAYKGSGAGSGTINLPTNVTVNTSGGSNGVNGDILMIGGSDVGTAAINTGALNANGGGTSTGGNIELYAATPTMSANNPVTITNSGMRTNQFVPSATLTGGAIFMNGAGNAGGSYTAKAGGAAFFSNITATGDVTLQSGATFANNSDGLVLNKVVSTNGNIVLKTTAGNAGIQINNHILANNGDITINANGAGRIRTFSFDDTTRNITASFGGFTTGLGNNHYLLGGTVFGNKLYVPDFNNGQGGNNGRIFVIDLNTNTVIAAVTGLNLPQSPIVSPDGTKLYVAESGTNTVAIIDLASNTISAHVSVGTSPQTLAITPDGSKVYVLTQVGVGLTANVTVIDTSNNSTSTVALPGALGGNQSGGIIINPQGTLAYVATPGNQSIYALDLKSGNNVIATIATGALLPNQRPYGLATNPTGTKLYITEIGSDPNTPNQSPLARPFDEQYKLSNVLAIDISPSSGNFNKIIANEALIKVTDPSLKQALGYYPGAFAQAVAVGPTGIEAVVPLTYLSAASGIYTVVNRQLELINVGGTNSTYLLPTTGPDNYGSSTFATVRTIGGVPVELYYTSNTNNVNGTAQTIGTIQHPTIQSGGVGHTITATSGTGDIIFNYDVQGGTITASTKGGVVLGDVGTGGNVGNISGSIVQLGSVNGFTTTGTITGTSINLINGGSPTGVITIGSAVGTAASTVVVESAGGMAQTGSGLLTGKSISLVALGGDIGSGATKLNTKTTTLSALDRDGDVFINNTGALNLKISSAGGTFNLANQGAITVATNGGIDAPNVNFSTNAGTNGSITLNAQVGDGGGTVLLNANGSGAIKQGKGSYNIAGTGFNFASGTGTIGSSATAPLRLAGNGANSVLLSTLGSAYIDDSSSTPMSLISTVGGTLSAKGSNGITSGGGITNSKVITLEATGGNISLPNQVGTDLISAVTLIAHGAGTIDAQDIEGKSLVIKNETGAIGTDNTTRLTTSTPTVTVTSQGDVFLFGQAAGGAPIPYAVTFKASTANSFDAVVNGQITVGGALNATDVSLVTQNVNVGDMGSRDVILGGNIGQTTGGSTTVIKTDNNAGATSNIVRKSGYIYSPSVDLQVGSGNGNIGALSKPISTKASTIELFNNSNAAGFGNVFVANTGNLQLGVANPVNVVNGTLSLTNTKNSASVGDTGTISIQNAINAKDVVVQTKTNGSIILNSTGGINATNSITLNANGLGTIQDASAGTSPLVATSISLVSGKGDIGSVADRIHVDGATVSVKSAAPNVVLNFDTSGSLAKVSTTNTLGKLDVTGSAGADVSLAGNVTAPNISIVLTDSLLDPGTSGFYITGKTVDLQSQQGSIGAPGLHVHTKVSGTFSASAFGDLFLVNKANTTIGNTGMTAGGFIDFNQKGTIVIAAPMTAADIIIRTTGGAVTTTLTPPLITGTNTVTLKGLDTTATKVVAANFGTITSPLKLDTPELITSTKGKVFVDNSHAGTALNNVIASQFNLQSAGDITVGGTVDVGKSAGTVLLAADDNITMTGGIVRGKTVTLNSLGGDIGAGASLDVDATNLGWSISSGHFVNLNSDGATPLTVIAAQGTPDSVELDSTTGNVIVNTTITATNNIDMNVAGTVSTGTKGLLNSNSFNIQGQAGIGTVSAPLKMASQANGITTVDLQSGNGSVFGTSTGTAAATMNLTASARGAVGFTDTAGQLVVGAVTAGNVTAQMEKTNNITIVEKAASGAPSLTVNNTVQTTGGSIVLNNANTAGSIIINDVSVSTDVDPLTPLTNGVIKIAVGKVPSAGTNPQTVSFNLIDIQSSGGGKVFFGPNTTNITGAPTLVTNPIANAKGRNVIFNIDAGGTGSIALSGSNTLVQADPPVASVMPKLVSDHGNMTPQAATLQPEPKSEVAPSVVAPALQTSFAQDSNLNTVQLASKAHNPYEPIAFISGTSRISAPTLPSLSLVAPEQDSVIETAFGNIGVKEGAAVLTVTQPNGTLSLYNLHDNNVGDVTFTSASGQTITVAPGKHITITASITTDFGDVNAVGSIAHRAVRCINSDESKKVTIFTSDFSTASALQGLPALLEMRRSHNPQQRKVANQIIKTAAILMQVGAKNGPYQRVPSARARVTAMQ